MGKQLEFLKDADNVYMTEDFIVKQELHIMRSDCGDAYSLSIDTFYKRTTDRDNAYFSIFKDRVNLKGKRIHAHIYNRTYID